MTISYRLTLANGRVVTIEDPFLFDLHASGALIVYGSEKVLAHAFAPGLWTTLEVVPERTDDAPLDPYANATRAAGSGA